MNMNPSASDTSLNAWCVLHGVRSPLSFVQRRLFDVFNICLTLCGVGFFWFFFSPRKVESVTRERGAGADETESNAELFVTSTNFVAFENSSLLSACAAYSLSIFPPCYPSLWLRSNYPSSHQEAYLFNFTSGIYFQSAPPFCAVLFARYHDGICTLKYT